MKDRIMKKLKEEKLDEQLKYLSSAYITTFDSFTLSLVTKYHTHLNNPKGSFLWKDPGRLWAHRGITILGDGSTHGSRPRAFFDHRIAYRKAASRFHPSGRCFGRALIFSWFPSWRSHSRNLW